LVKRAPSFIAQQLRGIIEAKQAHSLYNESLDKTASYPGIKKDEDPTLRITQIQSTRNFTNGPMRRLRSGNLDLSPQKPVSTNIGTFQGTFGTIQGTFGTIQ
jgi:hypothetical protein